MGLNQQIRSQAKLDSHRFAKGTVCRILHGIKDNLIIDTLFRNQLVPHVTFLAYEGDLISAVCNKSGRAFVVPIKDWPILLKLLDKINNTEINLQLITDDKTFLGPQETRGQKNSQQIANYKSGVQDLVEFLKQNMIMVRIPINSVSGSKTINPLEYDVIIETIDLSQTIDALLVDRAPTDRPPPVPKITDIGSL